MKDFGEEDEEVSFYTGLYTTISDNDSMPVHADRLFSGADSKSGG